MAQLEVEAQPKVPRITQLTIHSLNMQCVVCSRSSRVAIIVTHILPYFDYFRTALT